MKVAILHRYFWPESIATLPIMYGDIAEYHLRRGDIVTVCTGTRAGQADEVKERFGDAVEFRHFDSDLDRNRPAIWRFINGLRLLGVAIPTLGRRRGPKMVYLATYPPLFALIVMLLGRVLDRRRSHILYLQDNVAYRIRRSWLRRPYVMALKRTVAFSDLTLVISDGMRDEVLTYFDAEAVAGLEEKIVTLRNYSVDTGGEVGDDFLRSVDIVYAGNHGPAQNLELFIKALALMESHRPTVEFYGDGVSRNDLMRLAEDLGVPVAFHASIPRSEIAQKIMAARFGLVGAMPGLLRGAFPSKLANYNVLGVPALVMADPTDAESEWILSHGLGVAVDPASAERLAADLERALNAPVTEPSTELAARARGIYSKEEYFRRLDAILKSNGLGVNDQAVMDAPRVC